MKSSFKVNRYGARLTVQVDDKDAELEIKFSGTFDGKVVEGKGSYGMRTRDSNTLAIEITEGDFGSEDEDTISSAIDGSSEFNKWACWAMAQTDKGYA